jgi:hypothetical protein
MRGTRLGFVVTLLASLVPTAMSIPRVGAVVTSGPIRLTDGSARLIELSDDGSTMLIYSDHSDKVAITPVGEVPAFAGPRVITAAMSGDGTTLFIETTEPLVAGDAPNDVDLYRRVGSGEFERLTSLASLGALRIIPTGASIDGRFVVLEAFHDSGRHAYLLDAHAGALTRLDTAPGVVGGISSEGASISDDGRYVAFTVHMAMPGCAPLCAQAFRYDRVTGIAAMVSVTSAGEPANGHVFGGGISGDGRYVAFVTRAKNLIRPPSGDGPLSVFLHDAATDRATRLDTPLEVNGNGSVSLSNDGAVVAFGAWTNPFGAPLAVTQLAVVHRDCHETTMVSEPIYGDEHANGEVSGFRLDGSGTIALFDSLATNLGDPAPIGGPNVYGNVLGPCPTYIPEPPSRLLDTRSDGVTIDGASQGIGLRETGSVTTLQIAGRGRIGQRAAAVVVNVTVTEPQLPGFLTVYPCGTDRPNAANLNYAAGQTVGNNVLAQLSAVGTVCIFSLAPTHVIADVNGWMMPNGGFTGFTPARIAETRTNELPTVDGIASGVGRLTAGGVLHVPVAGRAGLRRQTGAVVLNVAAIDPSLHGFLTVYACEDGLPHAASLNYIAGRTVSNTVMIGIPLNPMVFTGVPPVEDAQLCVYSSAAVDVAVDLNGSFDASGQTDAVTTEPIDSPFIPVSSARLLETRANQVPTIDGAFNALGLRMPGTVIALEVAGRGGVPMDATAVVLNLTVTEPYYAGFLTVFPCGETLPNAANLNFAGRQTVGNNVVAEIGDGGGVCIFTSAATHIVADVTGALMD